MPVSTRFPKKVVVRIRTSLGTDIWRMLSLRTGADSSRAASDTSFSVVQSK